MYAYAYISMLKQAKAYANFRKVEKYLPKSNFQSQNLHKHIAWSFTTSLNRKFIILWGVFRLSAPVWASTAAGAVNLKKPHNIIILQFSEVVNDHATIVKKQEISDLPAQVFQHRIEKKISRAYLIDQE